MKFDLALIGFGVIGVESLYSLVTKVKKSKKLKIGIIEKDIKNIPGGVAYSKINSKFGYFNNPLRLSHPFFKDWIFNKKNIEKLILFIKNNPSFFLNEWLKNNHSELRKKNISNEIYFPRLIYSFYLEDKIIKTINLIKRKKIKVYFLNGNLKNIKFKKDYLHLIPSGSLRKFNMTNSRENLKIKILDKNIKSVHSKKILVGNGLLPPKKINVINKNINNNYIWDFYSEGGTNKLLKKINLLKKNKKKIVVTFIGNKAGLLETMMILKDLIINKKLNLKINVISNKTSSLNKAEFSKKIKTYSLSILRLKRIKKIKKFNKIFNIFKKEFKNAKTKKFFKYDVWTTILKNNILKKSLNRLSNFEKKRYNLIIFPKIRNLTRFTYPEPVTAKEFLEKSKKISTIKGKAVLIRAYKKSYELKLSNNKKVTSDIVVNVSGPVNLEEINSESTFIKSIKKNIKKFDKRGFITNKSFMLSRQIYLPGILSYNFNPSRQTIIKAITNNSEKSVNDIIKNI